MTIRAVIDRPCLDLREDLSETSSSCCLSGSTPRSADSDGNISPSASSSSASLGLLGLEASLGAALPPALGTTPGGMPASCVGGGRCPCSAPRTQPMFVLGIDHPMVDITAKVDDDFIERFDVPIGGACLANSSQLPLYSEMSAMPGVQFSPGGTTLNTIRVAHWALGSRHGGTGYMGAVGNDKCGDYLINTVGQEGVVGSWMRTDSATGRCASCLKNAERGLVTSLGAANEYRVEHLMENKALLTGAGIVYSTAFFFNCFNGESLWLAAEECRLNNNLFAFNLAAPYLMKIYKDDFNRMVELTDVLFGNEDEAEAYAEENDLEDRSARGVALHLARLPMRKNALRTVVITQGAHKTCLARSDGVYMEVPVPRVKNVVDTNAAGDAFVGGYLAGLASGKNLWACVEMAHKAAGHIIQQNGCTFKGAFAEL